MPYTLLAEFMNIAPTYQPSQEIFRLIENDDESYSDTLLMEDFARHLVALLERQETAGFPRIFTALGEIYTRRDPALQKSIIECIDWLRDRHLYTTATPQSFRPYLSPALLPEWDQVRSEEVIEIFLRLCPSFAAAADAEGRHGWWTDEEGYPMLYRFMEDFAHHLVAMLEHGNTAQFPAIFAEVERLLHAGNPSVQETIVISLLENLQNGNFYTAGNPEQFRPYLGKETEKSWDELNRFWQNIHN